ncbi:hypothetical protein BC629DRAFT_1599580 [Irpex lacteus]|nr:hypothetical protein BC629DRAFT_1599580 [Irpex lacteus]
MASSQPPQKTTKAAGNRGQRSQTAFRGFVHVDNNVASGAATHRLPRELSKLYIERLELDDTQRADIRGLYRDQKTFSQKFDPKNEQDQLTASAILAANHLDFDALEALDNKWSCRWSKKEGEGAKETQRTLYQCSCSYSHTSRGSLKRSNPFDSTGCLAHCEILYETQTHRVILIRGYLIHNAACLTATISRVPTWPIHPSVYEDTLRRLKDGLPLAAARDKNRELFKSFGYKDMPRDLSTSRYRWLLNTNDHRSIYRQFLRLQCPALRTDLSREA